MVDNTHQAIGPVSNDDEKIYHVYTDIVQVKDFLTHPRFVLVDNEEDADILWLQGHFKDFRFVDPCTYMLPIHEKVDKLDFMTMCTIT